MSASIAALLGGMAGGFIVGIWHGRRYDQMVRSYQDDLMKVIAERDFWHNLATKDEVRFEDHVTGTDEEGRP